MCAQILTELRNSPSTVFRFTFKTSHFELPTSDALKRISLNASKWGAECHKIGEDVARNWSVSVVSAPEEALLKGFPSVSQADHRSSVCLASSFWTSESEAISVLKSWFQFERNYDSYNLIHIVRSTKHQANCWSTFETLCVSNACLSWQQDGQAHQIVISRASGKLPSTMLG